VRIILSDGQRIPVHHRDLKAPTSKMASVVEENKLNFLKDSEHPESKDPVF
jgi:hypothetical protein